MERWNPNPRFEADSELSVEVNVSVFLSIVPFIAVDPVSL